MNRSAEPDAGGPNLPMTRRRSLIIVGLGILALSTPRSVAVGGGAEAAALTTGVGDEGLPGLLADLREAAELGRACLARLDLPFDRETLASLLHKRLRLPQSGDETAQISVALTQSIDQDLEDDDVVLVEGWLLPRTEALLLALVALTPVPLTAAPGRAAR